MAACTGGGSCWPPQKCTSGYINHFTQPDSIVPDPYNSQDWDRYPYARNNPVRYTDPTGHCPEEDAQCRSNLSYTLPTPAWDPALSQYVSADDKAAAERAYIKFRADSFQFAEYYVNPTNAPEEYSALEIFAEYSTLHTTADAMIWGTVGNQFGMDAAEALDNAQLHNLEAKLTKNTDDLWHVGGGASALWIITFGHGARHLEGLSVTEVEVNAAIVFFASENGLSRKFRESE